MLQKVITKLRQLIFPRNLLRPQEIIAGIPMMTQLVLGAIQLILILHGSIVMYLFAKVAINYEKTLSQNMNIFAHFLDQTENELNNFYFKLILKMKGMLVGINVDANKEYAIFVVLVCVVVRVGMKPVGVAMAI